MVEQSHSLADRMSDLARTVGHIGRHQMATAASVREPCASCGEETAVGSVFYSDRVKVPQPGRPDVFLCGLCEAKLRASHKPAQMTKEDVAALTRNASAAAITWWNGR